MDAILNPYVAGFMFSEDLRRVALIRKLKPACQRGLLNGIGGKVETGEVAFDAMVREFREESGHVATAEQWRPFCTMSGKNDDSSEFCVYFFTCRGDLGKLESQEAEKIEIVDVDMIFPGRPDLIQNLPWLVALALDHLTDGRPAFATVCYE